MKSECRGKKSESMGFKEEESPMDLSSSEELDYFQNIKSDTGGVESKNLGKETVDCLADGFGEVNHVPEHQFDIRKKVLFKAGEEQNVRDHGEAAEIP